MKIPARRYSCFVTLITLASALPLSAVTLIDYTFGGTDTGPTVKLVTNGNGTGGSSNTTTGVITTGDQTNSSYGFNSTTLVDTTSYTGFTATFEITSITLNGTDTVAGLLANGLFFGVVGGSTSTDANATGSGGTSLYSNTPIAFGYLPGATNFSDHQVAFNAGSSVTTSGLTTTAPTNASLIDGFTVSLSVFNDNTWSISSTGLSTELNDSGNLGGGLTYASFSNAGLYTSLQGSSSAQIDMARMTLVSIPEPSGTALLGFGCTLLLLRRRRA